MVTDKEITKVVTKVQNNLHTVNNLSPHDTDKVAYIPKDLRRLAYFTNSVIKMDDNEA